MHTPSIALSRHRAAAWLRAMLAAVLALHALPAAGQNAAPGKPVKVYILSGQSNMVGIGQVNSGSVRWGSEFKDPVLSVYPGPYDPAADYDQMTPTRTLKLDRFGGGEPTPFPGGGVQIVRGFIEMPTTGVYELRPGYGDSEHNTMTIDGKEVYRKEPGGEAKHTPVKLTAGERLPFQITFLTDNANGLGWIVRTDVPGTLTTAVKTEGRHPFLLNGQGNWAVRDDVWYRGVVTAGANKWLSVGCGASAGQVGPELGFGWVLGDYHDEPVLILKASQGNRSLGWDFLPPGSERFEQDGYVYAGYKDPQPRWKIGTEPEPIPWYAGKQYDDCFQAAHAVLADFDKNFPQWAGRGYEIAGFAWWQGHKDSFDPVHTARYEQNLAQLIRSLRKEFNAPDAPFVVTTVGFHGWEMDGSFLDIAKAQLAVSDPDKHPEFKGNVKTVETRDFWRPADQSPKDQNFHYNQNGETYLLVGQAMGQAMVDLLKGNP